MAKKGPETNGEVEPDYTGPRALTRLLRLFGVLAQTREGMSLAELNVALETPKSSLLNLLRPLVAEGYLLHANGIYRLGPSIFRLSAGVLATWDFPKQIRPFMEELSTRTGETVLLGVPHLGTGVVTYVELINSPHPVRYQIPVGTTKPLYSTTSGHLLIAYADKKWQAGYIASTPLKVQTAKPITRASLKRDIEQIRAEGLAYSEDATLVGLATIAAPVFNAQNRCIAALSIAGPTERFTRNIKSLKAAVKEIAARASGVSGSEYARFGGGEDPGEEQ